MGTRIWRYSNRLSTGGKGGSKQGDAGWNRYGRQLVGANVMIDFGLCARATTLN